MDADTRLEAKLRTLSLSAYDTEKTLLEAAEALTIRMYTQTHETINGRKVKMTARRRIAKYNEAIDKMFAEGIDIRKDAINMVKAIDGA